MQKLIMKLIKRNSNIEKKIISAICVIILICCHISSYAQIVSDNDGFAFVTKAELENLKENLVTQIDKYNTSIDNKVDGAIASFIEGLKIGENEEMPLLSVTKETPVIRYDLNENHINALDYPANHVVVGLSEGCNDGCVIYLTDLYFIHPEIDNTKKVDGEFVISYEKKNTHYGYGLNPVVHYDDDNKLIKVAQLASRDYVRYDQYLFMPSSYNRTGTTTANTLTNNVSAANRGMAVNISTRLVGDDEKEFMLGKYQIADCGFKYETTTSPHTSYATLTYGGYGPVNHGVFKNSALEQYNYWITEENVENEVPIVKVDEEELKCKIKSTPIDNSTYNHILTGGTKSVIYDTHKLNSCLFYKGARYAYSGNSTGNWPNNSLLYGAFEYPLYPKEKSKTISKLPLDAFINATGDEKWSAYDGFPLFKATKSSDEGHFKITFEKNDAYKYIRLRAYNGKRSSDKTGMVKLKIKKSDNYTEYVDIDLTDNNSPIVYFDNIRKDDIFTITFEGRSNDKTNKYGYAKMIGVEDIKVLK